jgi:cytochrome c oxidase assembly protein subunit 15
VGYAGTLITVSTVASVDFAPALHLLALAAAIACAIWALWWWRERRSGRTDHRLALAALAVFLTGDLMVFGAFTRLTDSGLGCPDWPGCYGNASPLGASPAIDAAEGVMPTGPVTTTKAWIEMIHRYLAMAVGALTLALAAVLWRARRTLGRAPVWALAALVWVVVQGLFGKYTVTLKLYPAVVTAHLLGGMVLLALLVTQFESLRQAPRLLAAQGAGVVLAVVLMQVALGGWVSTNYAVLACRGFPMCNGVWWPEPDFAQGFALLRELGRGQAGDYLDFHALVAIHLAHRLFALVACVAVGLLASRLWRSGADASRRVGRMLLALLAVQLLSGLSNVLLDWPLVAALLHTGCAAVMVALLVSVVARADRQVALPGGAAAEPNRLQRGI